MCLLRGTHLFFKTLGIVPTGLHYVLPFMRETKFYTCIIKYTPPSKGKFGLICHFQQHLTETGEQPETKFCILSHSRGIRDI